MSRRRRSRSRRRNEEWNEYEDELVYHFSGLNTRSRSNGHRNSRYDNFEQGNRRPRSQSNGRRNASHSNVVLSPTNRANHIDQDGYSYTEQEFRNLKSGGEYNFGNQRFPSNTMVVYTDGSALRDDRSCGIGVFHGPGHHLNRSQRVRVNRNMSTNTLSDLAEITAVNIALTDIKNWNGYKLNQALCKVINTNFRGQHVIIRTDYMNLINAMNDTYSRGSCAAEKEAVRMLAQGIAGGVTFEHVYGHSDDPGNMMADTLAKQATIGVMRRRSMSVGR